MSLNKHLRNAQIKKDDEYYTKYEDIDKELSYYKEKFKNKIIYCNCDTEKSNFYKFFKNNFEELCLKELIITGLPNVLIYYDGKEERKFELESGRFEDNINIIEYSDVIVTNPPFSLFRDIIAILSELNKDFILWGSNNAVTYKKVFPLIKEEKVFLGNLRGKTCYFNRPNSTEEKRICITVYTTFNVIDKLIPKYKFAKKYNAEDYPKFDNYDCIDVRKMREIPEDYYGLMAVPISFMSIFDKETFDLIGECNHGSDNVYDLFKPILNGKEKFNKVVIKRKQDEEKDFKLIHGNCFEELKNIENNSIDMILTDPPYGIDYVTKRTSKKTRKIKNDDNLNWLDNFVDLCYEKMKQDSVFYCFCSFHNIDIFKQTIQKKFKVKNILVWEKNNFGMGDLKGDFAPQVEFIIFATKGRPLIRGRRDCNILKFNKTRNELHPTQKPVDLLEFLIEKFSDKNDLILDCFMGSGSTGVACRNTNRRFIGMELDDEYFNTAKKRIEGRV